MFPVRIFNGTGIAGAAVDTGVLDVSSYDSLICLIGRQAVFGWANFEAYVVDEAGTLATVLVAQPQDDRPLETFQLAFPWGRGIVGWQAINLPLPRRVELIMNAVALQIVNLQVYGCREGR